MALPQNLGHKPLIEDTTYKQTDASFYGAPTDAEAISIGKAIYDQNEISVKLWRYGNSKWSRQSEELPLHRVIDMATFIINNLKSISNPSLISNSNNNIQEIRNYYLTNNREFNKKIIELETAINNFKSQP